MFAHLGVFGAAALECMGILGAVLWTQTKAIIRVMPLGQQLTTGGRVFVHPQPCAPVVPLLEELSRIQQAEERRHLPSLDPSMALLSSYRGANLELRDYN